ncbi:MAG: GNAT family N-acetyltransferase [Oscillospiraceae bacterium]|nr:GNAT family N-acetyltransferase [Oscillospiraceae bacterium]
MDIRLMTIEDYDQVYDLWLSCKGMGLNNVDDTREGIEKYLKRNPETSFVAEEDGKIVGVIIAGNDGRRGYIYHTAVHPDHRHQGIGTKLVDAALEALNSVGINKVALVVFSRNEDGNAFWEKIGFSERHDLSYRNKALVDIVRMDT